MFDGIIRQKCPERPLKGEEIVGVPALPGVIFNPFLLPRHTKDTGDTFSCGPLFFAWLRSEHTSIYCLPVWTGHHSYSN